MKDVFQMIQSSSPQLPLCRVDLVDLPVHRYSVDIFSYPGSSVAYQFSNDKKTFSAFPFQKGPL